MVDVSNAQMVYELNVGMTCEACSGAVTKILQKDSRISQVDCDIPNMKVLVTGEDGLEEVIPAALDKWVGLHN